MASMLTIRRTHRERRAEYLRRLENEVADLRRKDALQASRIRELEAVLTANSIEYPLHTINESMQDVQVAPDGRQTLPFPSENSGPRARVEIVGGAGEAQNLRITLPPDMLSIPGALSPMAADPQTAIDFVLSLEAPCLYHHHGVISATSADDLDLGPLSHAMMLQAPIMAQAPPLPATLRKQSYFSAGEAWDVSATEIERLLYFSMQLPLPQGEITPVQAWSRISSNADMTQEALNRMRSLLVKQMKCYGFGAVVDENLFQGALLEAVKSQ